jgi:hypothetical protein
VSLFLYGRNNDPTFATGDKPEERTIGTGPNAYALSNVRIVDGDEITVAAHVSSAVGTPDSGLSPPYLSRVEVNAFEFNQLNFNPANGAYVLAGEAHHAKGKVFAEPPNEHRDFPIDTLASDATYTISAWAVNDDDEVISPVAKLKVRPKDTDRGAIPGNNRFGHYVGSRTPLTDLTTTEFTVLK